MFLQIADTVTAANNVMSTMYDIPPAVFGKLQFKSSLWKLLMREKSL